MELSDGQIKSLIVLGICAVVLILLNVLRNRGSGSDSNSMSDWDVDDFDID